MKFTEQMSVQPNLLLRRKKRKISLTFIEKRNLRRTADQPGPQPNQDKEVHDRRH